MKKTFSLLVDQSPSVLPRITNLLARRGLKILSLSMGQTNIATHVSLIFTIDCGNHLAEELELQLGNLVSVVEVKLLEKETMISWELMLVKVATTGSTRQEILPIVELSSGKVVDLNLKSLTLQVSGTSVFLDTILTMLTPFEIIQVVRTGAVALERGIK